MPADRAAARWSPVVVPAPPDREPDPLPRRMPAATTAGAIAHTALDRSIELLFEHEPELGPDDDPEHVHQARVATRRLRSDLRTFRPLFDPGWTRALLDELRWLGRKLGAVRDADVLRDRLVGRLARLPAVDRVPAESLVERVRSDRVRHGDDLQAALASTRYLGLRAELVKTARHPRLTDLASSPAMVVLPPLARRPWTRLRRKVARLGADPTDAALHDVRIATKRCRYATQAVAPAIGEPAAQLARALGRLQDRLGEHQDAIVAETWLRAIAIESSPATAFVAGELVSAERRAALEARAEWPRAWRRVWKSRLR